MIYLAAHFAAVLACPGASGVSEAGPQLVLGVGVGVVAVGGPWFGILVLAANLASTWLGTPAWAGQLGYFEPVVIALVSLCCALGLRRALGRGIAVTRLRELAVFVGIVLAGACVTAAFGAWALSQGGPYGNLTRGSLFLTELVTDAFGVLLVAPGFIFWGVPLYEGRPVTPFALEDGRRMWELAAQVAALMAAIAVGRSTDDPGLASLLALVAVLWIGLRDGLHLSVLAVIVVVLGEGGVFASGPLPGAFRVEDSYGLILVGVALGVGTVGTSHRRLLIALRKRQEMLSGVLRGSRLGMWEWAPSGEMRFDEQWCGMFGFEPGDEVADESAWRKRVHREDLAHVLWLRDAHWKGHAPTYEAEYRFQCKDGTFKHVLDRGAVVERGEDGKPVRMAGTCLDLSLRKQTEAGLLKVVGIMDQAVDYIGAADLQGSLFYANQALMRLRNDTDLSAARRHHISEYYSESSAHKVLREGLSAALSRGSWEGEVELSDVSGRMIPASLILVLHRDGEGTPVCLSFVARDLTGAKRAEATERMALQREFRARQYESLSRLAGGVAHDFNNLLTPILGNVGMAEIEIAPDSPALEYLKRTEAASLRAAALCESLQLYAGKGRGNLRASDLNAAITGAQAGLRSISGDRIDYTFELAEGLPAIAADQEKIRHALELVVRNALESGADGVVSVRIRTSLEAVAAEDLADMFTAPEFRAGEHVVLELSDDCKGMSSATLDRLLEPFFAMTPSQQGMGLAVLLGIGMAHSGAVSVRSKPSEGNCFRLYFAPSDAAVHGASTPPIAQEWRGAGPVLVVDDEETVRLVATNMLESLGFIPLVARDGVEGVRVFRQHATALRAVLLDLTMPHMGGEQTYAEMRRVDADVPIVVMSGYSELEMEGRFKTTDPAGFLRKPFTRDMLRAVLHQVLVRRA